MNTNELFSNGTFNKPAFIELVEKQSLTDQNIEGIIQGVFQVIASEPSMSNSDTALKDLISTLPKLSPKVQAILFKFIPPTMGSESASPSDAKKQRLLQKWGFPLILENTLNKDILSKELMRHQLQRSFYWSWSENDDSLQLNYNSKINFSESLCYSIKLEVTPDGNIKFGEKEFSDLKDLEIYMMRHSSSLMAYIEPKDRKLHFATAVLSKIPDPILKQMEEAAATAGSPSDLNRSNFSLSMELNQLGFEEFCQHYSDYANNFMLGSDTLDEKFLESAMSRGCEFFDDFINFIKSNDAKLFLAKSDKLKHVDLIELCRSIPKDQFERYFNSLKGLLLLPNVLQALPISKFIHVLNDSENDLFEKIYSSHQDFILFLFNKYRYAFEGGADNDIYLRLLTHQFNIKNPEYDTEIIVSYLNKILQNPINQNSINQNFVENLLKSHLFNRLDEVSKTNFIADLKIRLYYTKSEQVLLFLKSNMISPTEFCYHFLKKIFGSGGVNKQMLPHLLQVAESSPDVIDTLNQIFRQNPELKEMFYNCIIYYDQNKFVELIEKGLSVDFDVLNLSSLKTNKYIDFKMYELFKKTLVGFDSVNFLQSHFIEPLSLAQGLANKKIHPNEVPPDYLLRLLDIKGIYLFDISLNRLVKVFYKHGVSINFNHPIINKYAELLLVIALNEGQSDHVKKLFGLLPTDFAKTSLLDKCESPEAVNLLLEFSGLDTKDYAQYLSNAIEKGNFEIISRLGNSNLISEHLSNVSHVGLDQEFLSTTHNVITNDSKIIKLLRKGVKQYPMLDVASRISKSNEHFIANLFLLSPDGSKFTIPQLRKRVRQLFILNPVNEIEAAVQNFVRTNVESEDILKAIEDELAEMKKIGCLVSRSRRADFYIGIASNYHSKGSYDRNDPQSIFALFVENQVAYGKSRLSRLESCSTDFSLLQSYNFLMKPGLYSKFRNTADHITVTPILGRYAPFVEKIESLLDSSSKLDTQARVTIINGSPKIEFYITQSRDSEIKIPVTTIETSGLMRTPSVSDSLKQMWVWWHAPVESIELGLPGQSERFDALKEIVIGDSEEDLKHYIDSVAGFFYDNAHLCITLKGNAQYSLDLMHILFKIHKIEVSPVKIDVTYLDCMALCKTKEQFIREFSTYFESPPKRKHDSQVP